MTGLLDWQSFYMLVGSSAGALIGLQFVVMALIAEIPVTEGMAAASGAFGTPNVVYFGAALIVSAVLSAPWHSLLAPAALCGALGLAGVLYVLVVFGRMRRQTSYRPELEDWIFYAILPLSAYAALAGAAFAAAAGIADGLYGVGAAALLLLFIGIHNAWDSITYHVFVQRPAHRQNKKP